jgi:hypothetical protein
MNGGEFFPLTVSLYDPMYSRCQIEKAINAQIWLS